mgnify:CR=1 FL=1
MNAHTPFDANQDWTNPYCQNSSNDPMVDALLGNAYHVVRTVYCNLGNLKPIYDFLNKYGMVLGVQSETELKAMPTSASYVRLYGFDNTLKRVVTDYLYVEGDCTGVIPDDPSATGSWILVATSNSDSGGDDGEGKASPPYIPYSYNNGSAIGGETTIPVPAGTVGVPMIVIDGYTNLVGYGFTYDASSLTVTLAQPLEPGDEVHLFLTGTPAVPDNPNVSDWVQINWLYNGGYASGGEQVIAIPYTFESVPAIYKNGERYYAGLADKSYAVDAANQRILLTEPLATNDRLIVQIGGESTTFIMSDRTVQEVARSTNVHENEVILSTNTTQYLNDMKVVYDEVAQKSYWLPTLPTNVYIHTVSNGKLTYAPGNIVVDLIEFVTGADLIADTGSDHVKTKLAGITSSVARTLTSKLRDSVSVLDFGAVGDGTTDDTAAINAALSSGFKHVYLVAGKTYVVKNGLTVPDGVTFDGYGAKINYIKPDQNWMHCITLGSNTMLRGMYIYCESGMVRDDTGFGISIFNSFNARVYDVNLDRIASAAIWATEATNVIINNCIISNGLADGIHMSDGCTHFAITNNIVYGCNDDHIAVVSDIPGDGKIPGQGVIQGNVISDGPAGHGVLLIGCYDVLVDSNVIRGMKNAAIGSYFWDVTGTPAVEDWVRNCTISNNILSSNAMDPLLADNATPFFVGALRDCRIFGNTIEGAYNSKFVTLGVPGNCIQLHTALNVTIEGNRFYSSQEYGIAARDSLVQNASGLNNLHIINNTFENIAKDSVHLNTSVTAQLGKVVMCNNVVNLSSYAAGWDRASYITNVSSLVMSGNKNTHNKNPFAYAGDTALADIYSNTPATRLAWTPNLSGQGGTPTGSATGFYWREGDTVFFEATISISAVNGASNPTISLPFAAKSGASILAVGRENTVTGKFVQGIPDNLTTLRFVNYDNTGSLTGVTATSMTVHGSFLKG